MKEAEPADYPNILRVQVLNPEATSITESLGITEERQEHLLEAIQSIGPKVDTLSEFISLVSKKVDNAAELAFATLQIGVILGKNKGDKALKEDKAK